MSLKKIITLLILGIVSAIAIGFSIVISIGIVGLPEAYSNIAVFISISFITALTLKKKPDLVGTKTVIATIMLVWFLLFIPKAATSTINFTLTTIPFFISFILAVGAGYLLHRKRQYTIPMLFATIPIALSFGLADRWNDVIVYGSASGMVKGIPAPVFSVLDKDGDVINSDSLKGKLVLLDFWFISCPPCWVKFPELERIYQKYKSDDRITIYAVNRPMKNDKPDQLFTSVEKKGFAFPVLRGTDEMIDMYEIDYFPTVIIVDPSGNIVYRGGIEKSEAVIDNLL